MERDEQAIRRPTLRLQSWDYSWPWSYYVTAVMKNRRTILGNVVNEQVRLSRFGEIVQDTWFVIAKRFKNVELGDCVVMPNHVHGIVIISDNPVGAIHESPLQRVIKSPEEEYIKQRRRTTLSKIMGWFKMNTAKRINLERRTPGVPVWQQRFHDHIIRNEADLHRIRTYIANNQLEWTLDEENPEIFVNDGRNRDSQEIRHRKEAYR